MKRHMHVSRLVPGGPTSMARGTFQKIKIKSRAPLTFSLPGLWNAEIKGPTNIYILRTRVLHNRIEPGHSGADHIGWNSMGWSNRQFHGMWNLYKNCKWVRSEHRPGKTKVPFLDIRVHPSTYILGSSFYLAVSTYIYNSAIKNLHASLIMPSKIHDAHHSWILSTVNVIVEFSIAPAHLNAAINRDMMLEPGRSGYSYVPFNFAYLHNAVFYLYIRVHSGSLREADFSIRVTEYPGIVFECGWPDFFPRLRTDKDLWIHGCSGHVQLVFIIKWKKISGLA